MQLCNEFSHHSYGKDDCHGRSAAVHPPPPAHNVNCKVGHQVARQDASNNETLFEGDEETPHLRRAGFCDVGRRRVHGKANAQAENQTARQDCTEGGTEGHPQGAGAWKKGRQSTACQQGINEYLWFSMVLSQGKNTVMRGRPTMGRVIN